MDFEIHAFNVNWDAHLAVAVQPTIAPRPQRAIELYDELHQGQDLVRIGSQHFSRVSQKFPIVDCLWQNDMHISRSFPLCLSMINVYVRV